jgi:hypothetical protein
MWVKISQIILGGNIFYQTAQKRRVQNTYLITGQNHRREIRHTAVGPNALDFRDERRERVCIFQVNVPQGCLSIQNGWICKKLGQN